LVKYSSENGSKTTFGLVIAPSSPPGERLTPLRRNARL
jgi:hypothetical protein